MEGHCGSLHLLLLLFRPSPSLKLPVGPGCWAGRVYCRPSRSPVYRVWSPWRAGFLFSGRRALGGRVGAGGGGCKVFSTCLTSWKLADLLFDQLPRFRSGGGHKRRLGHLCRLDTLGSAGAAGGLNSALARSLIWLWLGSHLRFQLRHSRDRIAASNMSVGIDL